jgi:hypothetical protein
MNLGSSKVWEAILRGAAGLIYAVLIFLFHVIFLTGVGHGWMSGSYSLYGVLVIPVFGVALAFRGEKRGMILAAIAFIGMLIIDWLIYSATMKEGVGYFRKTGEFGRLWVGFWVGWQVWAILFLSQEVYHQLRKGRASSA